jgi:3-deoxy-D-manno-octulosonic-acid transferase
MSATLDAAPVAAMLDDAPVITSEGRAFPVETRWREAPLPPRSRLATAGVDPAARVLLVDTTGELGWWWGTAKIAFVGGSLDGGRGGQNMLEPAAYGAAVSFGPHTRNFQAEVARLLAADAAEVVADGPALTAFVGRCLAEPAWAAALGSRAAALVAAHRGGTAATARLVLEQVAVAERPRHPA